jgi:hypothetical protein
MDLRIVASLAALLVCAAPAFAQGPQIRRGFNPGSNPGFNPGFNGYNPDLFLDMPLDYDTSVVYPFGGSHRNTPGTVTINRPAYYCTPHQQSFTDRDDFVAHLRGTHGLSDQDLPDATMVQKGQLRYIGQ